MSLGIGAFGDYGALSGLVGDSAATRARLNQLQQQAATGYVADTLGGLGASAARQVLNLRPQIAHQTQFQANIDAVQGRLDATQVALKGISGIASQFYSQLPNLNGLNPSVIDSVAASAKQALAQVASMLNTKVGDIYVFAGQTPGTAPVPNPDAVASSAFATSIRTAVAGLATNGATATAAATLTAAGGTSPFDPNLSSAPPSVQAGDAAYAQTGVLANANTLATSSGPSTTGSYMRDVLRSLATLAALSSSQAGAPGFAGLVDDTRQSLGGAISAMNGEAGVLGNIQSGLAAQRTEIGNMHDALKSQISSVTDVDMASTLSNLTQVQTQLQASYRLISSASQMNLASYL
jgi:flagellar hook-associated protein 3 FlgL